MSGSREGLVSAFRNFSGGRNLNVVHCSWGEATRDRRGSIKRQGPQEVRCEEISAQQAGPPFSVRQENGSRKLRGFCQGFSF